MDERFAPTTLGWSLYKPDNISLTAPFAASNFQEQPVRAALCHGYGSELLCQFRGCLWSLGQGSFWLEWLVGKGTTWKFGEWKWTRTRAWHGVFARCTLNPVRWLMAKRIGHGCSCREHLWWWPVMSKSFCRWLSTGRDNRWLAALPKRMANLCIPFMQYACWNMLNSELTCFWNWIVRRALWMWRPSCHEGAACGSRLQWVWFVVACPLCGWVANSPKEGRRT